MTIEGKVIIPLPESQSRAPRLAAGAAVSGASCAAQSNVVSGNTRYKQDSHATTRHTIADVLGGNTTMQSRPTAIPLRDRLSTELMTMPTGELMTMPTGQSLFPQANPSRLAPA